MQKNEIPAGLLLQSMWASMGAMHGTTWCAPSTTEVSLWSGYGMARAATAATHQEPKNSEQTEIPEEATRSLLVIQGPTIPHACRSWKQFLGIFRSVDESCTTDRFEREGERLAAFPHADGIAASAAAFVDGGTCSSRSAMDASSSSRSSCNAIHASAAGSCEHCDGSTAFSSRPTRDSLCGFAEAGEQCTTKAGPHCEGLQERGQSFSGVSGFDSCRDEEGRQGEHQRPFSRCQRTWQGERDIVGSGKRTPPTMVPVACFPAAISDQVEGIHGAVPGVRDGLPVTDARGHGQSPSNTTAGGHCQEEGSGSRHRREHSGAVGGRNGRDLYQGRRGNAKGRKRAENCGGTESGGQQPLGTLRVSRQTRAKTEETTKRSCRGHNRSCAWGCLFAQYAAFWQARCCVTNAYQHQGPVATCDHQAVLLHWSHTVLQEPFFTSPWMAIELAQDLAIEVGAWGPLRCEDFVLPPRRQKSKGTVKFEEVVEVLQGKDFSGKFHLQTTTINDLCHGFSPRRCPDDHRNDGCSPRQHESASSSSLGTASTTHFLDRRLSLDVPGYIHHLQHLWRDNLLRLPEGQPYNVRTWYLHHVHQRVWTVPREVILSMQPEGWHGALITAWRDQLHNDAVLNIAVVFPELRALRGTPPVHADLMQT